MRQSGGTGDGGAEQGNAGHRRLPGSRRNSRGQTAMTPSPHVSNEMVERALTAYRAKLQEAWASPLAMKEEVLIAAMRTAMEAALSAMPGGVDVDWEAKAKLWFAQGVDNGIRAQELLAALKALRDRVKDHPDFQGRDFVDLGIQVNNAIDRASVNPNVVPDCKCWRCENAQKLWERASRLPASPTPGVQEDTTQLLAECYARLNDHYREVGGGHEGPREPADRWSDNIIPLLTAVQRATGKNHGELMALGNTPPTTQEGK